MYKVGVACTTYASPNVIANHIITHDSKIEFWQRRLNSGKQRRLHQMQCTSIGIKTFHEKKIILCAPWIQRKQHKKNSQRENSLNYKAS